MKVGDLVKLKHQGNGHPNSGLIIEVLELDFIVLWDRPDWSFSRWSERELRLVDESR